MDPLELYTHLRRQELEAEAAAHRRERLFRAAGHGRPSRVLQLYARLWWATRPRAAAWTPGLLGPVS